MDYKEILRNKAKKLGNLLDKYRDRLSQEELNRIIILINNTFEITNGRLDALDYDVRNSGIMEYHSKLDSAMSTFKQFEPQEREGDKE